MFFRFTSRSTRSGCSPSNGWVPPLSSSTGCNGGCHSSVYDIANVCMLRVATVLAFCHGGCNSSLDRKQYFKRKRKSIIYTKTSGKMSFLHLSSIETNYQFIYVAARIVQLKPQFFFVVVAVGWFPIIWRELVISEHMFLFFVVIHIVWLLWEYSHVFVCVLCVCAFLGMHTLKTNEQACGIEISYS